ncbi:ABC transporter ATP-binding protein [Erythrobacter sp. HKB08]|uniref:ABC transporter ATP-binding protein n=1 Tax=Erythrobacter sp. HKB08 TaxID=2502843 RepID=UPI00100885B9|nr:ABC transporter ATP-binding protein [Erythrobacter sp. HKB08]
MLETRGATVAGRIEQVSTSLKPAKITAICGPNGAGKSTLLEVLAGLLATDAGTAHLNGQDIAAIAPRERAKRIGYLPQQGEVAWDVSVRNLVALGRLPHRDRGELAIERALAATDCLGLADRPASRLSGGEKARALLARVLAGEPDWILVDEPFAALDIGHRIALMDVLMDQVEAGKGVVMVVHDLALAMNHADRVIVLDNGRVHADAEPDLALSPQVLRDVWDVGGEWVGQTGGQALIAY